MRKTNENGFTLIEIVTIVTIIGILAAVAVPNILSWQPNMRLKAAARGLYTNMQKAKLEAVKRNTDVVVLLNAVPCPALPTIPSPGGSYSVFVDDGAGGGTANDGIQNGTEQTISSVTMPQDVALCNQTFVGSQTGFTSQGFLTGIAGSATMNNSRNRSNTITLTIAGGVRIQ